MSEATTPVRRNPRPVLALLARPRAGPSQTLTEIRFEEWCTRIMRDCRLPGTLRHIPAGLAASRQGFLAFLDPASLASFGATGVAMRGRRSRGGESSLVEAAAAIACREYFRAVRPGTARPGWATLCPGDSSLLPARRGHDLRTVRASWLARLDALWKGVLIVVDFLPQKQSSLTPQQLSQMDDDQCQRMLRKLQLSDTGTLPEMRQRIATALSTAKQPRVWEVVDGRRELLSEPKGLVADCLHAPVQWLCERAGTLLGVAVAHDPFNPQGFLADERAALSGVRWDPASGLWSDAGLFPNEESVKGEIDGAIDGFGLDHLNFRRTFCVAASGQLIVAATACRAHAHPTVNAPSTPPREQPDCRSWLVAMSPPTYDAAEWTPLPPLKPCRPVKELKLFTVRAPARPPRDENAAANLQLGPPATALDDTNDSAERRDAAQRWLERRHRRRGAEILVAVALDGPTFTSFSPGAPTNSITVYVHDEDVKAWVCVANHATARDLAGVCACDGAVLLDNLVDAVALDLETLTWRMCPSRVAPRDQKFLGGVALTAPDGSALLLQARAPGLVCRVRREDVGDAAPTVSRGAPFAGRAASVAFSAAGEMAAEAACLLPMPI